MDIGILYIFKKSTNVLVNLGTTCTKPVVTCTKPFEEISENRTSEMEQTFPTVTFGQAKLDTLNQKHQIK